MRHLPADTVTATRWLLPGDPFRVEKIAKYLEGVEDLGWSREFKMCEGTFHGVPVGVCSTGIGGPSTAIAAHELGLLGATHLVRVGTCGAIDPSIRVGRVCVATAAYYQGREESAQLTDFLGDYYGLTLSSDKFYGQMIDAERGLFVEMEAITLFQFAREAGLKAGCVCAVSDSYGQTSYELGIDRAIVSALQGIVG